MANRIRILPDETANRIAAGEVVERPASVVKELAENAIDASADRIVVEVKAGGKEEIRVSDNGFGMSRDDLLLSLERHATSKISDISDLRALRTLGFRGEALPSIAAVSKLVLETCLRDETGGTRVVVAGGRIREASPVGRSPGTTVSVRGLFFNLPARRKFLKGTETELRHVVNAVIGLAVAYPEIAFVLSHNGRQIHNLGRSDRRQRIESVLGLDLKRNAIYVERRAEGIEVEGFVGLPELARKSGASQALIVNGRWVHHKGIAHAIFDSYGGLLSKGLYPAFCIFLDVDPSRLDVNVHPSKREVRFTDERAIYRVLSEAVKASLTNANVIPEFGHDPFVRPSAAQPSDSGEAFSGRMPASSEGGAVADRPSRRDSGVYSLGLGFGSERQMTLSLARPQHGVRPAKALSQQEEADLLEEDRSEISAWQLHRRYILAHIKLGLVIIDQHVAHERVRYEAALDQFHTASGTGQRLLFPMTLEFGLSAKEVLIESLPLMDRMGFGIRDFGGNSVVVDAIPVDLATWQDGKLLREIVDDLIEDEQQFDLPPSQQDPKVTPLEHHLAASYACHTSIRSGDTLSTQEMRALIDKLFATREPFVCPHGRPIVLKVPLQEIDRRFGR